LAQALRNNNSIPSEALQKNSKQDTFKKDLKSISSDTYPAFINVYGVWKRYSDNSYGWVWLKAHTKYAEFTAEKWKDFTQGSLIWLSNVWNSPFYVKWWLGYLNLQDYKVWKYTIDPIQTTWWVAFWYDLNNRFNIEGGYLAHKLTWAKKADTTAHTKYIEWIYRTKTQIWQFDLTWVAEQQTAYWNNENSYTWSLWYYPTNDIKLWFSWNNKWDFVENDYQVRAWIKYTFGWWQKWHFSPYVSATYNTNDYSQFELAYEDNIANRPLQWKDKFENNINIKQIISEKVAPKEFEKRVKESFNKAPTINISANKTSVNVGENITLTANATDSDGSVKSITWYDSKWDKVWTWKTISITESTVWTYTYDAIATDNNWATTKSGSVSVEVKAIAVKFTWSEVDPVANVTSITKVSDTEYNLLFNDPDNDNWHTEVNVVFHGNKWYDTVPVTLDIGRYDLRWANGHFWDSKTVTSEKYPDTTITINFDWDWD